MSEGYGRRRLVGACAAVSLFALCPAGRALAHRAGDRVASLAIPPARPLPVGPGPDQAVATPVSGDEPLFAAPTRLDRVGRILAPVTVNGRGPWRFLVDTGANRSALSPGLVATLGLEATPGAEVRLSGVTGSAIVPTVRVARLEAGAVRLENRDLPIVAVPMLAQAEGILGVDGFAGKRLEIDFVRDSVAIVRSQRSRPLPGHLVVPARQRFGGLLIVDARIGTIPVRAVVDTGAARSLGNRALQRRLRLRPRAGMPADETLVYGATDAMQSADFAEAPPITFGPAELSRVDVTFGDLHVFRVWNLESTPALLVGMDVLGTVSRLVIDYRRSELQVRP